MLFPHLSMGTRFFWLLFLVLIINAAGFFLILQNVYQDELRSQAKTVVSNVEAFGAWVAKSGRVWVKADKSDSFLSQETFTKNNGEQTSQIHFFSKNPALAQREFSEAVMQSSSPAKFRMTSDNVMNPTNLPDAFELRALSSFREQTQAAEYEEFGQDAYRFAKPVFHQASCINCHGDPNKAPADVISRYGKEHGFGFKEGDLAGVISVTIAAEPLWKSLLRFVGVYEIGLILASMILFMVMVHWWLVKPIRSLTQITEAISLGKEAAFSEKFLHAESKNEIFQLAQAINRMRSSMHIAIKKMREARERVKQMQTDQEQD